jgi:hypothetical protein
LVNTVIRIGVLTVVTPSMTTTSPRQPGAAYNPAVMLKMIGQINFLIEKVIVVLKKLGFSVQLSVAKRLQVSGVKRFQVSGVRNDADQQ